MTHIQKNSKSLIFVIFLASWIMLSLSTFTQAQAPSTGFSALIVEPKTGRVLYENNADVVRYPASLTKLMTIYVIFDALNNREIDLTTQVTMTANAAKEVPSKLGAKPGAQFSVDFALRTLVVKSANDVAVAIGERISGSKANFIARMNQTAARLGMKNTHFSTPNGLPDPNNYSTAWDMYRLSAALYQDFPQYYPYFKVTEYTYAGKTIKTHNHFMTGYAGADGLKTGYIRLSGFNLATSVTRNNHHLIGIIIGGKTAKKRDALMAELMDKSYALISSTRNRSVRIQPFIDANSIREESTNPKTTPIDQSSQKTVVVKQPQSTTPRSYPDNAVIQVGAFKSYASAQNQARLAVRTLKTGSIKIEKNGNLYRALVTKIPSNKIDTSCSKLKQGRIDCLVYAR